MSCKTESNGKLIECLCKAPSIMSCTCRAVGLVPGDGDTHLQTSQQPLHASLASQTLLTESVGGDCATGLTKRIGAAAGQLI